MKTFKYEKPLLYELVLRIQFLKKEFKWWYSAWVDNAASRNHWSLNKNPRTRHGTAPSVSEVPEAPQIT